MKKIKESDTRNVVIIGGSASSFSCAWLLLNGPATWGKKYSEQPWAAHQKCEDCSTSSKDKCCCFGTPNADSTDWNYAETNNYSPQISIKILHRSKIRVFYPTVNDAYKDSYYDFLADKNGYIYSYTGLRGNAKALFKDIDHGKESRVKLIETPSYKEQRKHVEKADLVIYACGYESNEINILHHEGEKIKLS